MTEAVERESRQLVQRIKSGVWIPEGWLKEQLRHKRNVFD